MPIEATKKIWMDGEFVNWEDAKVHVLTHSLHYGMGVFEGIRAYQTPSGTAVFRLVDHINRLYDSAHILSIKVPFEKEQLIKATLELVKVNELTSCYIRPIVFLGYGEMGLNPLNCEVKVAIAAWPWGTYLGESGLNNGIRVKISSWRRHEPNIMPGASKATALYLNSALAKVEALKAGYDEAVLLNSQGYVSEGTGENIFVVKDGVLYTPPSSLGTALEGITQKTIITLANDMGLNVERRTLIRTDLYLADEVFFTGTAAEVVPINSVDDRQVGDGKPGRITKALQEMYFKVVKGQEDKYKDWLDYVS
jgi:branched-chain amino acid aminotransferase